VRQPSDTLADTLIDAIVQLEAVLVAEDDALRRFDMIAIALAAERKVELEQVIATALGDAPLDQNAWTDEQRGKLLTLRTRVGTMARANLRRLKASLAVVRGLVDHVTGAPAPSYGRNRNQTHARPVLASEIG
jgi:hypothetical protein